MSPAANSVFSFSGSAAVRAPARREPNPYRLIVEDKWSEWHDPVMDRLQVLVQLPKGWDGYSAPAVKLENAYFAIQMLKAICPASMVAPQIVPGSAGDLQIEWHSETSSIELHVKAPNRVSAWRESASAPDGEEIDLSNDFKIVLQWVREMLGDGSAAITAAA